MGRAEAPPRVEGMGMNEWKGSSPAGWQRIKVVGTPVGSGVLWRKLGGRFGIVEAQLVLMIPKLASLQASWLVLYFCAVPEINRLLRTLVPAQPLHMARGHDWAIHEVFDEVFSVPSIDTFDETSSNPTLKLHT